MTGVEDRVHFLGTRLDVPRLLPHFDVFWLASGYEGQSNALMEAMAAGVPVVATDIPANRELVVPDQTGYLVPLDVRSAFARRTLPILEDAELARRLGDAGRARMLAEFSVEQMVDRYAALYGELAAMIVPELAAPARHEIPTPSRRCGLVPFPSPYPLTLTLLHVRHNRRHLEKSLGRARCRDAGADDRAGRASRAGRQRQLLLGRAVRKGAAVWRRAWRWGIGGFRSSIWPAAGSRCRTKTARFGPCSMAKSTTFAILRRRLEGSGHHFRTAGDTETIVHLYEDEGPDFARHLWGMFAIAIWDSRQRQLVLARDRLGKKPLVYRLETDRLLFASELKCLLAVPGVPREVDPGAIDEYLTYQYVPHPNTIFRGIRKLPPAHYAVWRDGQMRINCYWQPDFNRQIDRPWNECVAELRELLTDAVRLRLQSDVPLGAFLSGGVDSSIIVGLMSQLAGGSGTGGSGSAIKTFSIGFADAQFDETHYARQVAERFGTEHHELRVEASATELLPKLIWHYDEPMADSSALPTWHVSQLARRDVTVALTGDGGDELFAGYDRYRAVWLSALLDRLPRPLRRLLASRFWQRLARRRPAAIDRAARAAAFRRAESADAAAVSRLDRHLQRSRPGRTLHRRFSVAD